MIGTRRKNRHVTSRLIIYVLFVIVVAFVIFPIVWIYMTAFKSNPDIYSRVPKFLFQATFANFERALFGDGKFSYRFVNTFLISLGATALNIGLGTVAAYGLSRYRIRGKNNIMFFILAQRFLPPVALMIPLFVMFSGLGLLDNVVGVIIAYLPFTLPFTTWLMKSFLDDLPVEIEESARVDGAGTFQVLRNVIFPLSLPAIAVVGIFTFLWSWNEFIIAFILTRAAENSTVSVGIQNMIGISRIDWSAMASVCVMSTLPLLSIAFLLQRYIIRGLTLGAVKG